MLIRSINLFLAIASLCAGGFLAWNHPLGSLIPTGLFVFFALLVFFRPSVFLIAIPALLPVIGFAPWTGWITFEELDLLILATAAGGYAKYAFDRNTLTPRRTSLLLIVLTALMSISVLVSMSRGFSDAGGFVFGWFQGYDGPMNSIRIGKSFFLALLLLPLITRLTNTPESNVSSKLAWGCAIGLGTASLAALWERLAFTDLLNFSSDYRTTALFWEMHVGGAALDGWLLLTIPFSIWALRNSRSTLQIIIALGFTALAAYASLTTFSRGVYLALAIALPLLAWQTRKHARPSEGDKETQSWGFFKWMIAFFMLVVMTGLVFPNGGYRGLLALSGLIVVSLSMTLVLRKISLSQFIASLLVGALAGTFLITLASFLPKGPYILYAALFALILIAMYWPAIQTVKNRSALCTVCYIALILSALNVSNHWGDTKALLGMGGAVFMIISILVWGTFSRQPLWPSNIRWHGSMTTAVIVIAGVVAVFTGGGYMESRFSTSGKDLGGRLSHWRQSLLLLQTPWDIAFGKGLGRFPANYYFAIPDAAFPGTYQISKDKENSWLSLVGSRHPMSFGDILRVSQRLDFNSRGPFEVSLKLRSKSDVSIHMEVCEKHLLYAGGCAIGHMTIKATNGEWQPVKLPLTGPLLSGGSWYAPRLKIFSLGIGSQSGKADVDDVTLTSLGGSNMLVNGDFSNEMQHWFFSSDRDHMPWHAKNLLVNITFDQGIAGLSVFFLLTLGALWRLNLGKASNHDLSPYLTAAIIGFLIVGMFDSLADVPRLAFLYYLLVLYSLSLRVHRHR